MKPYKHLRYSVLYHLKRGASVSSSLTFRCNYSCSYCTMRIEGMKTRKVQESTLQEWKQLFDSIPQLKEVFISGGEPTLMPYFVDLVNHLTSRKVLVTVFTNLSFYATLKVIRLKPSAYLRILASFHENKDIESFINRFDCIRRCGHQISVDEIEKSYLEIRTNVKPRLTTIKELKDDNKKIRFAPDRKAYQTCYDLYAEDGQEILSPFTNFRNPAVICNGKS